MQNDVLPLHSTVNYIYTRLFDTHSFPILIPLRCSFCLEFYIHLYTLPLPTGRLFVCFILPIPILPLRSGVVQICLPPFYHLPRYDTTLFHSTVDAVMGILYIPLLFCSFISRDTHDTGDAGGYHRYPIHHLIPFLFGGILRSTFQYTPFYRYTTDTIPPMHSVFYGTFILMGVLFSLPLLFWIPFDRWYSTTHSWYIVHSTDIFVDTFIDIHSDVPTGDYSLPFWYSFDDTLSDIHSFDTFRRWYDTFLFGILTFPYICTMFGIHLLFHSSYVPHFHWYICYYDYTSILLLFWPFIRWEAIPIRSFDDNSCYDTVIQIFDDLIPFWYRFIPVDLFPTDRYSIHLTYSVFDTFDDWYIPIHCCSRYDIPRVDTIHILIYSFILIHWYLFILFDTIPFDTLMGPFLHSLFWHLFDMFILHCSFLFDIWYSDILMTDGTFILTDNRPCPCWCWKFIHLSMMMLFIRYIRWAFTLTFLHSVTDDDVHSLIVHWPFWHSYICWLTHSFIDSTIHSFPIRWPHLFIRWCSDILIFHSDYDILHLTWYIWYSFLFRYSIHSFIRYIHSYIRWYSVLFIRYSIH